MEIPMSIFHLFPSIFFKNIETISWRGGKIRPNHGGGRKKVSVAYKGTRRGGTLPRSGWPLGGSGAPRRRELEGSSRYRKAPARSRRASSVGGRARWATRPSPDGRMAPLRARSRPPFRVAGGGGRSCWWIPTAIDSHGCRSEEVDIEKVNREGYALSTAAAFGGWSAFAFAFDFLTPLFSQGMGRKKKKGGKRKGFRTLGFNLI